MTHTATLQVVNMTSCKFTNTNSHTYQMNNWKFSDIPSKNYQNFDVEFYSGHHDEDDGADAYYLISDSASSKFDIQGKSTNDSAHYLQVNCQSQAPYVLVTNKNASVINPSSPHDLIWSPFSANATYQIGYVNNAVIGLGIVDLNLLFPNNSTQVSTYQTAIANNNLTYDQLVALSNALNILVPVQA